MRNPSSRTPLPLVVNPSWSQAEGNRQFPDVMPDGSPWPRISIVTPSFNQGQFLTETIRSILLQRYPNLEYIIIDGGSSDNTIQIIQEHAAQLAYWVSEPDRGQSHAINKGFAYCTGDIITFCSSDDIYLPGTFADVALKWYEHQEVGAIIGAFQYLDAGSRLEEPPRLPQLAHAAPVDLSLEVSYRLHQVSTFYSGKALDNIGRHVREDLQYTMDRELLYRVCRQYPILLTRHVYGAFRRHDDSKSAAHILAFAEEFAKLQYLFVTDNERDNRVRRRLARHYRAKGYLKLARGSNALLSSIRALLLALWFRPSFAFQLGYVATWMDKLHLRPVIEAFEALFQ